MGVTSEDLVDIVRRAKIAVGTLYDENNTDAGLARFLGVGRPQVGRWKNGAVVPRPDTMRLLEYLACFGGMIEQSHREFQSLCAMMQEALERIMNDDG